MPPLWDGWRAFGFALVRPSNYIRFRGHLTVNRTKENNWLHSLLNNKIGGHDPLFKQKKITKEIAHYSNLTEHLGEPEHICWVLRTIGNSNFHSFHLLLVYLNYKVGYEQQQNNQGNTREVPSRRMPIWLSENS